MKHKKYKIEDISIGDLVYFDSQPGQSNHDLYWVVHAIDAPSLMIQLRNEHYWTIHIDEVYLHTDLNKG